MKKIKFKHSCVKEILEGRKLGTWRLFDDKDLRVDDELELVDAETEETFARAKIAMLHEKKIKDLTEEEFKNHGYRNMSEMIVGHIKYYGNRVNPDTDVKIIEFMLLH